MEEQSAARGAERQISQLVQNHQIKFGQVFGDLSCFAFCFFQLKGVDRKRSFPCTLTPAISARRTN